MTVAFDAIGQATTSTGSGLSSQTWNHTAAAGAVFGIVMTQFEDDVTRTITGVTWDGVAMTKHSSSPNDGGEGPTGARQYIWYIANPATGTKSIVATASAAVNGGFNARSVSFTGTSLEISASAISNTITANPKISVVTTADSTVVGMLNSGQDTAAAVAVDANTTGIGGVIDVGATQHAFARLTANTSGTDGPGWTVASEDALMYAVAISEVSAAAKQYVTTTAAAVVITAGTPALKLNIRPTGPTVSVTPATGTVSLAGTADPATVFVTPSDVTVTANPAVRPTGPTVAVTAGTVFLSPRTPVSPNTPDVAITPGTVTLSQASSLTASSTTAVLHRVGKRMGSRRSTSVRLKPVVAAATASWTPLSLPSLAGWYDASDTASITASSNRVSQWNDKSGNARHLTQGTGSNQPRSGLHTVNSRNVVEFARSDDTYMDTASFSLTQAFTVYIAFETTTMVNGTYLFRSLGGAFEVLANHEDYFGYERVDMYAGSDYKPVPPTVTANPTPNQVVMEFNGASSNMYYNGGSANNGNPGASNFSGGLRVGSYVGGGTGLDGYILEFVITDASPTASDLTNWNTYCARWGL